MVIFQGVYIYKKYLWFSSKAEEIDDFIKSPSYYSVSVSLFCNIKQYECYCPLSFTIDVIQVFSDMFLHSYNLMWLNTALYMQGKILVL